MVDMRDWKLDVYVHLGTYCRWGYPLIYLVYFLVKSYRIVVKLWSSKTYIALFFVGKLNIVAVDKKRPKTRLFEETPLILALYDHMRRLLTLTAWANF